MSDTRPTATGPLDAADVRRAVIAIAAATFVALAAVTLTTAPGGVGGRLLLLGLDGVFLGAFAALGFVVAARCARTPDPHDR